MTPPDIVEFVTDEQWLGLTVSPAQETLIRAIYGLPLTAGQLDLWRLCTGREFYPERPFGESTVLAGARGGKDSRIAAPIACYEAVFGGHERHVAKGERAVIPVVAPNLRTTRIAAGYIADYFTRSPLLSQMVADERGAELVLSNGFSIYSFPCTASSLRGWSIPAAVMDELGFFRLEGKADSDVEIQASIRRGMISFPGARLVKISTPYMKSGVIYEDFRRYFGSDSQDALVWRASSALMNPSLDAARLDRERRVDSQRFAREYEAEFEEDLDAFLPPAWVDGAVAVGVRERPPLDGVIYTASCDAAGGSLGAGADEFTVSVVHVDGAAAEGRLVHDLQRGYKSARGQAVDLAGVVREIVDLLRRYRLSVITGDAYAGQWVRQAFEREGIRYEVAPMDRARAYVEAEALFAQGRIEILDHPMLVRQLKQLERRPRQGGRVVVDHPRGQHDDHANSLCLATALLVGSMGAPARLWGGEGLSEADAGAIQREADAEYQAQREAGENAIQESIAAKGFWWPGE